MPANPLSGDAYMDFAGYDEKRNDSSYNPQCQGETKYEKAFWLIFSKMVVLKPDGFHFDDFDKIAKTAVHATDAGFKALDAKD